MIWTDEQIAELKRLWADGIVASKIAQTLHTSKNSVLRRVHDLSLPLRRAGTPRSKAGLAAYRLDLAAKRAEARILALEARRPSLAKISRGQAPRKPIPVLPATAAPSPAEPHYWPVPIVNVTGCRFAVSPHNAGRGEHLFCNKSGYPWCEKHRRVVYQVRS